MDQLNKPEYVSSDILEDNFVKIFIVIYRVQYIFGSGRVEIKNRFVTPPTTLQKRYSVFFFTFIFASIYFIINEFFALVADKTTRALGLLIIFAIVGTSFCNIIHTRFLNGHKNVDFHVKMQKLDRLLKLDKNKNVNRVIILVNAVSVISEAILFVLNSIVAFHQTNMITFVGLSCFWWSFTLELMASSSIVVFCLVRVRFVNFVIESYLNQEENLRNPVALEFNSKIKMFEFLNSDINFAQSEVHIFLKEIFSCFNVFRDLYQFQFLLFSINYFVLSLLTFEILLYTTSHKLLTIEKNIGPIMTVIIHTFIAIILAISFEKFFIEVKKTKRLCIEVMALHQQGPLREKARAMLKMIEETPPKFSVYDMWDMNASMFVTMLGLVTSLIVTLLQFAVL